MTKFYSYLVAGCMAVASLASCSRSHYAFKPAASAYHGTVAAARPEAPAPQAAPAAPEQATAAVVAQPAKQAEKVAAKAPAKVQVAAAPSAPAKKAAALQKKVATKVVKQFRKHQETASATEAQSKAGRAAIVAGVGILLWLLGYAAGIGLIALIGFLAFIVGIILLIVALINGN